jgi:UDP-N-acetylmuramyl pentapeptide phosphotransferase/UDP-N-acetylglucosamine-1-phosphate transferase
VLTEIVLGVAVLALLIYRQLRTRPVNASGLRIVAVLGVIGLLETYQFLQQDHDGAAAYAAIAGSLVIAAAFGALRAATVRLWLHSGQRWSRGSWLTAALWIVALAAHLVMTPSWRMGTATAA